MESIDTKNAQIEEKIGYFTQKAGEGKTDTYLDFLHIAIQPLLFSTDLLYKLWINFKGYKDKSPKNQPDYLVVSDLILSSLCRPIGTDLFRIDEQVREYLLEKQEISKTIKEEIANFIDEYVTRHKSKINSNIYEIHKLSAMAVINPEGFAQNIEKKIIAENSPHSKLHYLKLYFDATTFDETKGNKMGITLKQVTENESQEGVITLRNIPKYIEQYVEITNNNIYTAKKPVQIFALENHLGFELTEIKNIDDILDFKNNKTYILDNQERVIGLNISNCKINDILFLRNLEGLESLNLFSNQITDISFLQYLHNLTSLSLCNNLISDIYPLENLTKLTFLDLGYNQILDILFLKDLVNLTHLDLFCNPISNFYVLQNLINLEFLNLFGNAISDISFLNNLINLVDLDLANNKISDISLDFLNHLSKLKKLSLHNNPIKNIPKEIFNKDENVLKEVRDYLEEITKRSVKNKEVKIILLGNGNVGKTQIARRLAGKESFVMDEVHNSTHGIQILRSTLGDFEVNIWDFAGQDLYYATHRLFMQNRALFILVWDFDNEKSDFHTWENKQYENEKLQYWLEYIKCFSKGSPILVIQNKIDKPNQKDFLGVDKDKWKKDFPIVDFLQVGANSGKGFLVLENILEQIFENNPVFQDNDLPTNWLAVREIIKQKQTEGIETITKSEFKAICEVKNCASASDTLLGYLYDTGVFYYRQGYFDNQIILNQSWAIETIYKILNRENKYISEIVAKLQKGTLLYKNICKIWGNNTDAERELFIDFMVGAELAFETTKNSNSFKDRTFAVPSLFPVEKPEEVIFYESNKLTQSKKEEIKYTFLPKVFIQRFIILANRFSEVEYMWQKGLYLSTQEGDAIVEADYQTKTITILSNNVFVTKKIEEELESIANEGNLKGRIMQGENTSETEKYWGLNALSENINRKKLVYLLNECFDNEGIHFFCFKYFEEVSNNFTSVMPKLKKIITLIKYCEHHMKIDNLLEKIKEERPEMYSKIIGESEEDTQKTKNNENINTEIFKKLFKEATSIEISDFLNIFEPNINKIPTYKIAAYKTLKDEFVNQSNNFELENWKARFLVLINDLQVDKLALKELFFENKKVFFQVLENLFEFDNEVSNNIIAKRNELIAIKEYSRNGVITNEDYFINTSKIEKFLFELVDSLKFEIINPISQITKNRKLLFLSSDPEQYKENDLIVEFAKMKDSLDKAKIETKLIFHTKLDDLLSEISDNKPTMIHFIGNKSESKKDKVQQTALNKKDEVKQTILAGMLPSFLGTVGFSLHQEDYLDSIFRTFHVGRVYFELVFLSACYSENQANIIKNYANYVIGTTKDIGIGNAEKFATLFYDGLAHGDSIVTAFELAKLSSPNFIKNAVIHSKK